MKIIAMWNIRDGRNSRLETALRAADVMKLDLCLFAETKFHADIYTRKSFGYEVWATRATSG